MSTTIAFHRICTIQDIPLNAGVCALVDGKQIAVFRVGQENAFYAIDNYDPFSKANVLSRGIVGTKDGIPKVASPIYKQQFCLETGECFDDPEHAVRKYPVREQDGEVFVSGTPSEN